MESSDPYLIPQVHLFGPFGGGIESDPSFGLQGTSKNAKDEGTSKEVFALIP